MPKKYYVKLRISYHFQFKIRSVVISLFANSEEEIRKKTVDTVSGWKDIKTIEIIKFSTFLIEVHNFEIDAILKYKSESVRTIKFRLNAEDKVEAEQIFRIIAGRWKQVVGIQIVKIDYQNTATT